MKIIFKGHEVEIEILKYIPEIKGYTYGLPENCYPDEPMELEWIVVTGNNLLNLILENDYYTEINDQICKQLRDSKDGKY